MQIILLIFFGAGLGGVCRYLISDTVHLLIPKAFPFGTLTVNITGCFFMGLFVTILLHRYRGEAPLLSAFLLIGFLGGYTTFSSFAIESLGLFSAGAKLSSVLYVSLSVFLCLLFVWLGQVVGEKIF